jgi:hypothetical protein
MSPASPTRRFPTTAWSCIRAAQDPDHPQFRVAMNRLTTTYWKPVFHFLRASGRPVEQAEEVTQEFFLGANLTLARVRGWRSSCHALAGSFDEVMR